MLLDVPLINRIEDSKTIVQGRVVQKECRWDIGHNSIFTVNYIEVLDHIKGKVYPDTIIILTRGGIVGKDKQVDYPSLRLNIEDVGVFLLEGKDLITKLRFKSFIPKYVSLGFIKFDINRNLAFDEFTDYGKIDNGFYSVFRRLGLRVNQIIPSSLHISNREPNAVSISSFTPSVSTAGTFTTLTINGSGFGSSQGNGKVEFRNADNGGSGYMQPIQSEYESWTDTQIKVKIPSGAGTGDIRVTDDAGNSDVSSTDLTISYNLSNINYNGDKYRPNLVDADGSGGILFEFYTDFYNNSNARDAYERALGTWRCSNYGGTGVYFADGGSSTVDVIANDNTNIVRFDNGNELSSNVLGRMSSYYSGCGSPIKWFVKELDVVFNDVPGSSSYTWNFNEADNTTASNQYDFESVAVHEIGHGHQLGHVIDATKIMHYSISNGTENRELSQDDLDAGNDVISFSNSTCGKPEMNIFVCAVIPLKLLQFYANKSSEGAMLKWEFENVFDLDKIELQKSNDGINFEEIGFFDIDNHGLSRKETNIYSFLDNKLNENNYYRLKIFDIDGSYYFSKKLFVFGEETRDKLILFPNPVFDKMTINNTTERDIQVDLLNNMGCTIFNKIKVNASSFSNIDFTSLPRGVYYLRVNSQGEIDNIKIIKD